MFWPPALLGWLGRSVYTIARSIRKAMATVIMDAPLSAGKKKKSNKVVYSLVLYSMEDWV